MNIKRFSRQAFIALCLFISPLVVRGQSSTWTQSNGPYGGFVNSLTYLQGAAVAGTRYGVYITSDKGSHWGTTTVPFSTDDITDVAVGKDMTILVDDASASNVFVSIDGGRTMQPGAGLANTYPNHLMISRSGNYFAAGVNVYKSTDRGVSWHESGGASSPSPFEICEDSSGVIYAAEYGKFFASTDDGESWTQQLPGPPAKYCYALQADAAGDIFIATDSVTYRSTDRGKNWSALTVGTPSGPIVVISATPGIIYAAGYWGFYKSTDNGDDWTSSFIDASPTSILVYPNSTILVGSLGSVLRSTDGGLSWTEEVTGMTNTFIGPILTKASGDIFAASAAASAHATAGVFHSTDNGNSWTEANLRSTAYSQVNSLVLMPSGSIIAATRGSGIYRTSNNAANWQRIGSDIPDSNFLCLAVSQTGQLLAGTQNHGAFLSTDQGDHWANVTKTINDTAINSAAIDSSGNLIISTTQNIYYSTDMGAHWISLGTGLTGTFIGPLAVNKSGTIFVYQYGAGFLQGSISGGGWQNKTAGLPHSAVSSITLDHDTLYVTTDTGIFRSTNEGTTWIALNDGISGVFNSFKSVAIGPNGYLFAGSYGDGVFRIKGLKLSVGDGAVNSKDILIYPNPSSGEIHIQYTNQHQASVVLSVTNALGETVMRTETGNQQAGTNELNFDIFTLVSGVYRIVLSSDFEKHSCIFVVEKQ